MDGTTPVTYARVSTGHSIVWIWQSQREYIVHCKVTGVVASKKYGPGSNPVKIQWWYYPNRAIFNGQSKSNEVLTLNYLVCPGQAHHWILTVQYVWQGSVHTLWMQQLQSLCNGYYILTDFKLFRPILYIYWTHPVKIQWSRFTHPVRIQWYPLTYLPSHPG